MLRRTKGAAGSTAVLRAPVTAPRVSAESLLSAWQAEPVAVVLVLWSPALRSGRNRVLQAPAWR
jgi:hypothetical protein